MADHIIFQRRLPHYRIPLFEALYRTYGSRVVTSADTPDGSFLNLARPTDHEWAIPAPFVYPDPAVPERAVVPVGWALDTLKPAAVVSEFGLRLSSSFELPLRRRLGQLKRLSFWSHGWQMGRSFNPPVDWSIQYSRIPLFGAADVIATYSEEGASWVKRSLPRKPVVALGNSLDLEPLREVARTVEPWRFGSPQLLCVGRLTADKEFDRAINVVRTLRSKYPQISLTLIGDGPERARLTGVVDEDLKPHIHFLGEIYEESKLAPHFLGADLLLLTGAAGLTVNHALAYGLPVVAFRRAPDGPWHHPEIEYVVPDKTGILVSPHKTDALAAAICHALDAGLLADLRRSLPTYVDETISLAKVVENFGTMLELLLK